MGSDSRMISKAVVVRDTVFGFFLGLYDHILSRTTFLTIEGLEALEHARATGKPIILAAWHGQDHMLYRFLSRRFDSRTFVLIVDGAQYQQVLATYVRMLGYKPIPIDIQDSSMAAAKAVIKIVGELQAGKSTLIAPDGPEGPAREPKAGIAAIARRAGAVILPIALHTDLAIRTKRWDGKYHPFPFARIRMGISEPIDPESSPGQAELLVQVRNALNEVTERIQPEWPAVFDLESIQG
jgi:lysophospholipid acyltransferase (LPLAT)-like uncharacterized protein